MAEHHIAVVTDTTHLDIATCLHEADVLKAEGNDYFRLGRWDEALATYQSGLGHLPKRTEKSDAPQESSAEETTSEPETTKGDAAEHKIDDRSSPQTDLEKNCAKARAVLNANIGACYIKLGDHKQAVAACSQALLDDPHYVKALQRRAASNDQLSSWSSLTAAQEDYSALIKLLPPTSPLIKEIERSLQLLKPRLDVAQKQETAEMLDKLKGLGNSILGNFGLSTDNFKFEPNGQGGYSMNFSQ